MVRVGRVLQTVNSSVQSTCKIGHLSKFAAYLELHHTAPTGCVTARLQTMMTSKLPILHPMHMAYVGLGQRA